MNLTHYLLLIVIALLMRLVYPDETKTMVTLALGAALVYGCYWLIAKAPGQWRLRRAQRDQEKRDEDEYWIYKKEHDAIRVKYDPQNEWNEASTLPREYRKEIADLNRQHLPMLIRRNGWDPDDFDDDY